MTFSRFCAALHRFCIDGQVRPTFIRNFIRPFASKLQGQIIQRFDPVIKVTLAPGIELSLPMSHHLPLHMAQYPHYDSALPRLARAVKEDAGSLKFIDVGANVGDTAVLVSHAVSGAFLCVEGSDQFFPLLERNLGTARAFGGSEFATAAVVLDERDRDGDVRFFYRDGTALIDGIEAPASVAATSHTPITTLDRLLETRQAAFFDSNFLKIDTDGYDYRILRGASSLLSKHSPWLFFEFSPPHLIKAGEEPMSIFPWLRHLGYESALFYTELGLPTLVAKLGDEPLLRQIVALARTRRGYFDILVAHAGKAPVFDAIVRSELDRFGSS